MARDFSREDSPSQREPVAAQTFFRLRSATRHVARDCHRALREDAGSSASFWSLVPPLRIVDPVLAPFGATCGIRLAVTILVSQLWEAGILMASDSLICERHANGRYKARTDLKWEKLYFQAGLKVGFGFWGCVGAFSGNQAPSEWLKRQLEAKTAPTEPDEVAKYVATCLESACRGEASEPVGIHVACFTKWTDQIDRPTFWHIHNQHGHFEEDPNEHGSLKWIEDSARKPFREYRDFPRADEAASQNELAAGFETRNGMFEKYALFAAVRKDLMSKMVQL